MAIDFSRADIDGEIGTIDGVADIDAERLITHKWNDPRAGSLGYWRLPDDRMPSGRIRLLQDGRTSRPPGDRSRPHRIGPCLTDRSAISPIGRHPPYNSRRPTSAEDP